MRKDLYLLAKKSIAFDANYVESLNKKIAQIDSRLYLFAYYQPKKLPNDIDVRGCFNLAVLNMYGLLWDCGKMVMCQLFGKSNNQSPSIIQPLINTNLSFCNAFFSIISNVRTCLCHNNSDYFFYNREKQYGCQSYLENTTAVLATLDTYNESQWERVCQDFLDRCQRFATILDFFLDQLIQETNLKKKNQFVQYWINSISKWYESDLELIAHVLADRYKLKSSTIQRSTIVTKIAVKRWIESGWKMMNGTRQIPDLYADYTSACSRRIPMILADHKCPKPALPLEVLTKATADAATFVLSRKLTS